VGGGDHPDIDLDRPRLADRHHLALLQHPQERHLRRRRQLGDLVEEEAAAVGRPDIAGAILERAGEGAAAVAEELGLDQARRQGAAVDRDVGPRPRRQRVQRPGDDLLAGAGGAAQEHRHVGAGDPGQRGVLQRQGPGEGGEAGGRRRQAADVEIRRAVDGASPVAEEEEGMAELEDVAILEDRALHRRAVDDGAVLRALVLDRPAAVHPGEPGVARRHPAIGDPQLEQVDAARAAAARLGGAGAADGDRVDPIEQVARRRRERGVALQEQEELGRRPVVAAGSGADDRDGAGRFGHEVGAIIHAGPGCRRRGDAAR
jgi:hypothetical protein